MNASLVRRHGSEAGIALPITLILMALITSLTVAFLAFTSAEPVIAANQMANTQARAIAESGVERVLWALSKGTTNPGFGGSLSDPLPNPVPAPYNGTYVANGVGGFKVTVAAGPGVNERTITSVGYVPNDTNPVAIKKIQTVLTHIPIINPPCAVCAGGEAPPGATTNIQVGGSASITASTAQGAQYCAGMTPPTAATYSQGTVGTNGHPNITGPSGGSAMATNQPASNFAPFIFTDSDMATLKSLAKANGTYYQGNQHWTSPPPNGIIFVDTPSGNVLTNNSPSSDLISVDIHGNWGAGWNGWMVVAGSIQISGNITLSGLIYAQNDVTLHGAGGGSITGAVISTNRVDTQSTNVDTDDIGNAPVSYNCPAIQNAGGGIPRNWFVKPGSYKEVSGT